MGETTRRGFLGLLSGLFVSGGALTRKKLDEVPAKAEIGPAPAGVPGVGNPGPAVQVYVEAPRHGGKTARLAQMIAEELRKGHRWIAFGD